MVTRERLLAIALTLVMVTTAGCAGWGTDGPADDQGQGAEGGETQADEGNGSDSTGNASDNASNDSSDASDAGSSSGDTGADSGDSSDGSSGDGDSYDAPADDGSSSAGDDTTSDSDSDSDTGDSGSSDGTGGSGDTDTGDSDTDTGDSDTDGDQDQVDETERALQVTVVDEDGDPIEGASVHATGPVLSNGVAHEPAGKTNADGVAMLTAYDGEYGVEAQHDGTTTDKKTVIVDDDTEVTVTIDTSSDEDPGDDDAPYSTLTVTVEDSANEPVEGVEVIGIGPEGEIHSATTDANGQATFDLSDGPYTYSVTTDGTEYADSSEEEITMDGSDQSITLTIQAGDGDETNTLTVNLATDDVDGVEITVQRADDPDEPEEFTKASENGQAVFELEPGHYYADAEGYVGTLSSVDVTGDDVEITLQNRSGATVPVKVTDAETGEPIAGAEISGLCHLNYSTGEVPITGTTSEDGVTQAHADVTPAWCTGVQISADGYEDAHTDINVPTEETVTVELTPTEKNGNGGENETDGEPATQTLTVTIIDITNAGPMQGTATVNGETKEVPGDRGAQFEVENGTYTVTGETSEDGWHVVSEEVTVDGDDTKVTLIAQPIHTLTVDTGEPGVDVTLTGPAADEAETKTTGDDGRVEFEALPGDYSVTADGYESADVTVPVEYEPVPVELTPKTTDTPTHTLTVTVTDATGDPVENASVSVVTYDGGADVADGTTDENGEVTFDLEDGSYELAVSADGLMQPSDQRLVEINGEDTTAEVQLQETGGGDDTATGIVRVVDSNGDPIEGEPVKITPPATVTERATEIEYTDENGEVVIELAAGEPTDVVMYGVEVRGEKQTLAIMSDEHVGVQVVEFQPTDRMYLFETVIYVTDENGDPVEGVPVEARHGMLGDDPANEWELVGETDENGEVVLTGGSSIPDDVIEKEVRVGDQEPFTTYVEADKRVEEVTINQRDDPAENGAATNETANETDAATPAAIVASPPAVPAG